MFMAADSLDHAKLLLALIVTDDHATIGQNPMKVMLT